MRQLDWPPSPYLDQLTESKERQKHQTRALRAFLGSGVRLLVLLVFALFFGVPLLWLLLAPTKTAAQFHTLPPLAPGNPAYIAVAWDHLLSFNKGEILLWIRNSLFYSCSALLISVVLCLLAGYGLATREFAGRKATLLITLIAMIVPSSALVLPLFLEINALQLYGTAWSVILPMSFYPFGVYLAYIYFSTTLPPNLLAAGRVDGCSEIQLFTRIALPLATPLIALLAFFNFVDNWNNYFLPFVMLSDDTTYNLPVGLSALIAGTPAIHPAYGGSYVPIYQGEVALAGIITILPILVVFLFSQRFLITGILSGAQKE